MAVPTIQNSIIYDGNNSTVVPYPVPFPFLSGEDIKVAIRMNDTWILLNPSQYHISGAGLTTSYPWPINARLQIFRNTTALQPIEFPINGSFPASANEEGLDRAIMLIQEMGRRIDEIQGIPSEGVIDIPGSGVELAIDVLSWSGPLERGTVVPRRANQLGVQASDKTLWVSASNLVGAWLPVLQTDPIPSQKITLGFTADSGADTGGVDDAIRTAAAALFAMRGIDELILGGDNTGYASPSVTPSMDHAPWLALNVPVNEVWGNHDGPLAPWLAARAARYPNDPRTATGKPYGVKTIGNGLIDLFVLDSGMDGDGQFRHPDGVAEGSAQHQWFVGALAASRARWKIVAFHHPFTSPSSAANRVVLEMAWPELQSVDLILNGHDHITSITEWRSVMIVNASRLSQSAGNSSDNDIRSTNQGRSARQIFIDPVIPAVAIIIATPTKLRVELREPISNTVLATRGHDELSKDEPHVARWTVVPTAIPIPADLDIHIGTLMTPTIIRSVTFATGGLASTLDVAYKLYIPGSNNSQLPVCTGTWAAGHRYHTDYFMDAYGTRLLPRGTILRLSLDFGTGSGGPPSTPDGLELILSVDYPCQ